MALILGYVVFMKYKPSEALVILNRLNANADFHTLSSSVVDELLKEADKIGYRKPKNANGSRGRYFHAYLVKCMNSLTNLGREAVEGKNCTVVMQRGKRRVEVSSWNDGIPLKDLWPTKST